MLWYFEWLELISCFFWVWFDEVFCLCRMINQQFSVVDKVIDFELVLFLRVCVFRLIEVGLFKSEIIYNYVYRQFQIKFYLVV